MAFGHASLPTRKYCYGVNEYVHEPREPLKDGSRPPRRRFDGHAAAVNQLSLANKFQNKLVELERKRRDDANAAVLAASPRLAQQLADAEAIDAEIERVRTVIKRRNIDTRMKLPRRLAVPELQEPRTSPDAYFASLSDAQLVLLVRTRQADARSAWRAYTAAKKAAFSSPAVRAALDAIDAANADACSAARRAAVADGLYWPTSLQVATRVKKNGPPPKFKRFTGEGVISIQFQRKPDKSSPKSPVLDASGNPRTSPRGATYTVAVSQPTPVGSVVKSPVGDDLIVTAVIDAATVEAKPPMMAHASGESLRTANVGTPNTLCYVEPRWNGVPFTCHPERVWVHFRVGSSPSGEPVWAKLPAVMHRDMPDGEIKWAHLSCRRVGTHYKWEVLFDIARPEWNEHPAGANRATDGTVAVALGWRVIDGEVRAGEWVGTDGATGTIRLPRYLTERWEHIRSLQSIRDKLFDTVKAELLAWIRSAPLLPDEFAARTATLAQWNSPNRLARLVLWWRNNRFAGDADIFQRIEGELVINPNAACRDALRRDWRKKRRAGDRTTKPNWRNHYSGGRKQDKHLVDWQANLRSKVLAYRKDFYRHVAIDLSYNYKNVVVAEIDWHEIAENPQPESDADNVIKKYRALSACATLRDCLTHYMNEVEAPVEYAAVTCCECGRRMPEPGAGRWVRCECGGGERRDRAENVARNLLARGLSEVSAD